MSPRGTDMVTATLALTEQYAAATTEAQSSQILAAGQAIMVLSSGHTRNDWFLFYRDRQSDHFGCNAQE